MNRQQAYPGRATASVFGPGGLDSPAPVRCGDLLS